MIARSRNSCAFLRSQKDNPSLLDRFSSSGYQKIPDKSQDSPLWKSPLFFMQICFRYGSFTGSGDNADRSDCIDTKVPLHRVESPSPRNPLEIHLGRKRHIPCIFHKTVYEYCLLPAPFSVGRSFHPGCITADKCQALYPACCPVK